METTEIIKRIRFKAADTNEVKYSDYDILLALNEAYRFFRNICLDEAPELLATEVRKRPVECNVVFLPMRPIQLLEVRYGGNILHRANHRRIYDTRERGVPEEYVVSNRCGEPCLLLYPIPQDNHHCEILLVGEVGEIKLEDVLHLPLDYVENIVDFTVTRLTGQDSAAFTELADKLRHQLRKFAPGSCVVDSYY